MFILCSQLENTTKDTQDPLVFSLIRGYQRVAGMSVCLFGAQLLNSPGAILEPCISCYASLNECIHVVTDAC